MTENEIDIMWDDLCPDTQKRLLKMLGGNGNYDIFPITTIYGPEIEPNKTPKRNDRPHIRKHREQER